MSGSGSDDEDLPKIPVTILTGFLGAGKTTLVNQILTESHGVKFAVIENEYGDVGVDDELVKMKQKSDAEVVEMMNGCICCTVRTDLSDVVKKILKREDPIDAIIIETTGLADPGPVAQTFFLDDHLQMRCRLDGIITVVDAKHVLLHLYEEKPEGAVNEAVEQVAFADRILLNKTDLVDAAQIKAVKEAVWKINTAVQIQETVQCRVDPASLVDINAFNLDRILESEPDFLGEAAKAQAEEHGHGHGHGAEKAEADCDKEDCKDEGHGHGVGHAHGDMVHAHGHSHDHGACDDPSCKDDHVHDFRVSSVSFLLDEEVSIGLVQEWIGELLQTKANDLFRYKGILAVKGNDRRFVFQGVHMMFTGDFMSKWGPDDKKQSRFVIIGKNLDKAELEAQFRACIPPPLRFDVGDAVEARVQGGYQAAKVIKLWDEGNPYRVKLDEDGVEVWAPEDLNAYIRERLPE